MCLGRFLLTRAGMGLISIDVPVFYTMGCVWSAIAWPLLDTTAVVSLRMIRPDINNAWEREY